MSMGVVRVRGTVNLRGEVRDTLELLRLSRPNHCVVVPPREAYLGMLHKAKDYITWGELRPEVLSKLLALRGRLTGNRPLTENYVKEVLGFPSIDALAENIVKGDVEASGLNGVKPVFRLSPPRKGYERIKRPYADSGALGYRGEAINDLLLRMLE
ncbi:MAG: 50S ribosomal protein L30 [Candidatus Thermoplasmatota archaeon]|nr:50S ribosomal protein L30 [Candidatus Thermoplasmatota archaeon]